MLWANSWSPDGRFLLYAEPVASVSRRGNFDLKVLPGHERKPVPFMRDTGGFNELDARFSPMGRWVAYVSNQSGVKEVYVREFATDFSTGSASTGESVLVSRGGGNAPRWRGDGRELFYLAPGGKLMAVDVTASAASSRPGRRRRSFRRRLARLPSTSPQTESDSCS